MSDITTTIARMVERLDEQSDTIFRLRKEMAQAQKFKVTLMFGVNIPTRSDTQGASRPHACGHSKLNITSSNSVTILSKDERTPPTVE